MARRSRNKRPESVSGGYSAIPWCVVDSNSFKGASDKAKSLLFALMRQHNGSNNGRLHLAKAWLYRQGWTCDENNRKARKELLERGLIIHTKQGGLNMGANLFALTWFDISNYIGLDIDARTYRKGAYALCDLEPTRRRKPPSKKTHQPDYRASTGTTTETVKQFTGTTAESVKGVLGTFTGTTTEHNVITPLPIHNSIKRIESGGV